MRVVLLLLFLSPLNLFAQEAFEGVITYKIQSVVKPHVTDSDYIEYYQNRYGDSVRMYFSKDGSHRRDYLGKSDMGFEWRVYDSKTNIEYAKWKGIDTVYCADLSKNFVELKYFGDGPVDTVLGMISPSVTISTRYAAADETMTVTYYYTGKQKIPPFIYSRIKDGFMDRVYEKTGSHFIKYQIDLSTVTVVGEAIRIEPGKIDPKVFLIPSHLPKKDH